MNINVKRIFLLFLAIGLFAAGWWMYKRTAGDITDELFTAVRANNIEEASNLIEQGADVNAERGFKHISTPLVNAVKEGEPEMVALLLSKGASVGKLHDYEWSPLTYAISIAFGRCELMTANRRVPWKTVRYNQRYIIPLLVAVDAQSDYPEIFAAILSDNLDKVKKLTPEAQAELQTDALLVDELLRAAIYSMDKQIIDYVVNEIVGKKAIGKTGKLLQWAIESDDADTIDYMLKYPLTDINAQDQFGNSPLHTAVIYPLGEGGNLEAVQKLLQMGANPNLQNYNGDTPLHSAVNWAKGGRMAQLLMSHGADATLKNNQGISPADILSKNSSE